MSVTYRGECFTSFYLFTPEVLWEQNIYIRNSIWLVIQYEKQDVWLHFHLAFHFIPAPAGMHAKNKIKYAVQLLQNLLINWYCLSLPQISCVRQYDAKHFWWPQCGIKLSKHKQWTSPEPFEWLVWEIEVWTRSRLDSDLETFCIIWINSWDLLYNLWAYTFLRVLNKNSYWVDI